MRMKLLFLCGAAALLFAFAACDNPSGSEPQSEPPGDVFTANFTFLHDNTGTHSFTVPIVGGKLELPAPPPEWGLTGSASYMFYGWDYNGDLRQPGDVVIFSADSSAEFFADWVRINPYL